MAEEKDIDSGKILNLLSDMHKDNGWIFFKELRIGTGYGSDNEQRIDAWAINAWPSYKSSKKSPVTINLRRSFEIKISRSDVQNELRNPDKRWMAYAFSHEFYFVCPSGLISPKELAEDDGLIEYDGLSLKINKFPRVRESMPPKWSFVASLARRISEIEKGDGVEK